MKIQRHIKYKNKTSKFKKYIKLIFFFILMFTALLILFYLNKVNSKKQLTHMLISDNNIYLYQFSETGIYRLQIPGNTLIDASQNNGKLKLSKIYNITNSNYDGGEIVKRSVIKNFYTPIESWVYVKDYSQEKNRFSYFKYFVGGYANNSSVLDRTVVIYNLIFKGDDIKDIDLKNSLLLESNEYLDKSMVYEINGELPDKIANLFADEIFSSDDIKIIIRGDNDNNLSVIQNTIEILGAKPVWENQNAFEVGCEVSGNNKYIINKLLDIFDCRLNSNSSDNQYSAVVSVGEKFIF